MSANNRLEDNELVEAAIAWLRDRLPANWCVGPTNRVDQSPDLRTGRSLADTAIDLRGSNGVFTTFAVEAKRSFGPRNIDRLLGGVSPALRALAGHIPLLVVASWLSPRTRTLLANQAINYIDLTGNALARLDNPTVFIQSAGADRDPSPQPRGKARVRGPKAARLVRLLADVSPPYGVRDIAAATRLNPGYVSRLLDSLDNEALIERSRRGRVESVEIPGLLRRWAESYDLFKTNVATTFIARAGVAATLSRVGDSKLGVRLAVTGSFAAVRLAAVAGPALLAVYADEPRMLADRLDLLPTDEGANVVLLQPFDPVVWERVSVQGVSYVAPSQAAVDCLTGNGRMPAEGEALLGWMVKNQVKWRLRSLDDVTSVAVTA